MKKIVGLLAIIGALGVVALVPATGQATTFEYPDLCSGSGSAGLSWYWDNTVGYGELRDTGGEEGCAHISIQLEALVNENSGPNGCPANPSDCISENHFGSWFTNQAQLFQATFTGLPSVSYWNVYTDEYGKTTSGYKFNQAGLPSNCTITNAPTDTEAYCYWAQNDIYVY